MVDVSQNWQPMKAFPVPFRYYHFLLRERRIQKMLMLFGRKVCWGHSFLLDNIKSCCVKCFPTNLILFRQVEYEDSLLFLFQILVSHSPPSTACWRSTEQSEVQDVTLLTVSSIFALGLEKIPSSPPLHRLWNLEKFRAFSSYTRSLLASVYSSNFLL